MALPDSDRVRYRRQVHREVLAALRAAPGPLGLADLAGQLYPTSDHYLRGLLDEMVEQGSVRLTLGRLVRSWKDSAGNPASRVFEGARLYSLATRTRRHADADAPGLARRAEGRERHFPSSRPPRTGRTGRITTALTVWCGDCGASDRAAEDLPAFEAARTWRAKGWGGNHVLGWLCPSCLAESRVEQEYPE